MKGKQDKPIAITKHFYQMGTPSFPAYLSLGDNGMIIEGGTGATFAIIVEQIAWLGIDPGRIKFIALTHTHADHIGAVPHLKRLWPHLKVAASPTAARLLADGRTVRGFRIIDRDIADIMLAKGEIENRPPQLDKYVFEVDQVLEEGDQIDLGAGVIWTVYDTPGHSPCHISLYEQQERTLMIGDATGFYVPQKCVFWPNYFESLEAYCRSIKKLSALPAIRGALCHNGVIEGNLREYFTRALAWTGKYHLEMLTRIEEGEDPDDIAMEKARWVSTLTDIQTLEVIRRLARLLISRSQLEAAKESPATLPRSIR